MATRSSHDRPAPRGVLSVAGRGFNGRVSSVAADVQRGLLALVLLIVLVAPGLAQISPEELRAAIDQLGEFDYGVRREASRVVRRAAPDLAVPTLLAAAREHEDSYVQFRAGVLLSGFGGTQALAFFEAALSSTNDRVRAAAYDHFEHAPDPARSAWLVAALDRELSEFVRPALVRALAAHDDDADVRDRLVRDIDRGEEYFRGAVIEALGDYRATYAVDRLIHIASESGPVQDDALLALGKIGDTRALRTLAAAREGVSEALQPIVSAAACLLGVDCPNQLRYVVEALSYGAETAGEAQELVRSSATGLAALAMSGHVEALDALFDVGAPSADPARAPIALAIGTVALRRPATVVAAVEQRRELEPALLLIRDAFDMLDEDMAEERFYVCLRSTYWESAEGSRRRKIAEAALNMLEF